MFGSGRVQCDDLSLSLPEVSGQTGLGLGVGTGTSETRGFPVVTTVGRTTGRRRTAGQARGTDK